MPKKIIIPWKKVQALHKGGNGSSRKNSRSKCNKAVLSSSKKSSKTKWFSSARRKTSSPSPSDKDSDSELINDHANKNENENEDDPEEDASTCIQEQEDNKKP